MKVIGRLIQLVTVLGGVLAVILGNVGVLSLSAADQVIIGLLAFLAIDAVLERIGVLRRIEQFISEAKAVSGLRPRSEIPRPDVFGQHALSIDIIAVSAVSIITQYRNFYRERLKEKCRIRVVLLDPDSDALGVHARQSHGSETVIKNHIYSTIAALAPLLEPEKSRTNVVELKLISVFLPFSVVAVDLERPGGSIVAEFHTYRCDLDTRAHVVVERQNHKHWYTFFKSQLDTAWDDAAPISKELVKAAVGLAPPDAS
jgi:hypothetical protein